MCVRACAHSRARRQNAGERRGIRCRCACVCIRVCVCVPVSVGVSVGAHECACALCARARPQYAGERDPLPLFRDFVAGYMERGRLSDAESAAVPDLVILRILSNVVSEWVSECV